MRARTRAVVAGDRLVEVYCEPPLTLRRVDGAPGNCALCLVGSAAGPLAGDDLHLDLELRPDARATLQASGATIAQGSGGNRTLRTSLRIGAGARLASVPAPVVVAHGARLALTITIDLAADAAVAWRELIVLGRSDEPPGAVTLRWDVTRAGRPVLRQLVDLADPVLAGWRGMTAGARVLASALVCDPGMAAATVVHSPLAVTAKLDEHTTLTTVLGSDAARAQADLDRALSSCPPVDGL
jgi:urease accessory protein